MGAHRALAATSLGLVVPVRKDAGQVDSTMGQLIIAGATVADFGAVILLSLFFSESDGGTASKIVTFATFAFVVVVVAVTLARAGRSIRFDAVLTRLQDTTAEIRVRIAVALPPPSASSFRRRPRSGWPRGTSNQR